ncbi:MAG: PepSY domain-containing protein [Steroidobacteraceae bacterium]
MRVLRILHKWLGLIVGLQILLWTMSGLVFAWLDYRDVAGEPSVRAPPQPVLAESVVVAEPSAWLGDYGSSEIVDIALIPLLDHWVYRIRLNDRIELRRAEDGARFAIDAAIIRALAGAHYADGDLRTLSFHATPTIEARDAGPVWQAAFDDAERTSLYFAAGDGWLVAARNDTWRLFDFFWMLHTMDYRGRDDFNHPLVILFGTGALWLAISGGLLLFRAFGR